MQLFGVILSMAGALSVATGYTLQGYLIMLLSALMLSAYLTRRADLRPLLFNQMFFAIINTIGIIHYAT